MLFGEVFLMTGDKDLADARTNRKIYSGHCTSIIANRRNKGYYRHTDEEGDFVWEWKPWERFDGVCFLADVF